MSLLIYYCEANHIVTISRKNKLYSELPVKVPKVDEGGGAGFLRLFFIASLRYFKFKSNQIFPISLIL